MAPRCRAPAATAPPTIVAPRSPPQKPDQVFFGLTAGHSFDRRASGGEVGGDVGGPDHSEQPKRAGEPDAGIVAQQHRHKGDHQGAGEARRRPDPPGGGPGEERQEREAERGGAQEPGRRDRQPRAGDDAEEHETGDRQERPVRRRPGDGHPLADHGEAGQEPDTAKIQPPFRVAPSTRRPSTMPDTVRAPSSVAGQAGRPPGSFVPSKPAISPPGRSGRRSGGPGSGTRRSRRGRRRGRSPARNRARTRTRNRRSAT